MRIAFPTPDARIPLSVRQLQENDIPRIFDLDRKDLSAEDKAELHTRLEHLHANIPTCYVAVTADDTPAYLQWLMSNCENHRIQAYFNGIFPLLAADEALLENAFTLHDFRGKGVMPAAMACIAEQGKEIGVRRIITFVEENNIPSLKGCRKAGFSPYVLREETWFLFRRKLTFTKLSPDQQFPF
jgi:GNAT superfamily N-acetyltransferase